MSLRRKTIALDRPLTVDGVPVIVEGAPVTALLIEEPTFDAVIEHGEPWIVGQGPDGSRVVIDNPTAISAYVDVCLVGLPRDTLKVVDGRAKLAVKVRDAINDFFLSDTAEDPPKGTPEAAGSTTSPTTSSDTGSATPTP